MLSYRQDNEKLYVNKGNRWDAIGSEKEVSFYAYVLLNEGGVLK